jgi:hypothetical protein
VEQRDARHPANPWQFLARVPQTNQFQTFAAAPPANTALRVWEFVADPAIVDLNRVGGGPVQLVLYGAPPKSYEVQTTNSLDVLPAGWVPLTTTGSMTNSFHLFSAFTPTEPKRFYRAREH